jgi:hypothetical protein
MQSMLTPKPSDDPHDIVAIAPDAIRMAPADEEIESLLKEKLRAPSAPPLHAAPDLQLRAAPDLAAGATVPPVDTTFRATAVNDVLRSRRRSMAGRLLRGVAALLLAACIGGAAMAWRYHGEAALRMIAEWAPLFAHKSSQPSEKTGLTAPPVLAAAEVDAANASPAQPAPAAAQTAAAPAASSATAEAAAPAPAAATASSDEPQSLETMARDLANASQEIEQLKASVEQLKASQQQLVAMVAEKAAAPNLRPKKPAQPAPPPRPVAALTPVRQPASALPPRPYRPAGAPMPSTAAAPYPPPAPYVPRQIEPPSQTATETLNDPELAAVPRPPMPLR